MSDAVTASLIAVMGTFAGSAFTLWMTGKREENRAKAARSERWLADRREIYARFLTLAAPLRNEVRAVHAFGREHPVRVDLSGEVFTQQMDVAIAEIEITGAETVASAARGFWGALGAAMIALREDGRSQSNRDELKGLVDKLYTDCLAAMKADLRGDEA